MKVEDRDWVRARTDAEHQRAALYGGDFRRQLFEMGDIGIDAPPAKNGSAPDG